jgi:hypothetical protein
MSDKALGENQPVAVYTDTDFLRWDPFGDDRDVDIRARTVKVVTTRKAQQCHSPTMGAMHPIAAGTRARYERAIVDGRWGAYYTCTDCMVKWLTSNGVSPRLTA